MTYETDIPAPATAPPAPAKPSTKELGKPRATDAKAQEKAAKEFSKVSGEAFLDYYKATKRMSPAERANEQAMDKLKEKSFEKFDKAHNELTNQMLGVTPPPGGEKKRFDEEESRASKTTGRMGVSGGRSKPGADKAPETEEVKPGTASWIDFGKGGK